MVITTQLKVSVGTDMNVRIIKVLPRKEFYLEEFATAMEVLAALDLNEKPSRKWYYEITGSEYVLTVTNIFQHGMVK